MEREKTNQSRIERNIMEKLDGSETIEGDLTEVEEAAKEACEFNSDETRLPSFSIWRVLEVLFVSLLLIWLVSVISPLVGMVIASSGWRLLIALSLLLILVISVGASAIVLLYHYYSLPRIIKYNRVKFNNDKRLAKIIKEKYISRWDGATFSTRDVKNADKLNEQLLWLQKQQTGDGEEWLNRMQDFQMELDKAADVTIGKFSTKIGAYTVASQAKITDMATVVVFSALMLRHLGVLYRQRVSILSAFQLAIHWIANVYFASWLQGNIKTVLAKTTSAIRSVGNKLTPAIGLTAEGATVVTGIKLASAAVTHGGEFVLNKLLAKQLGGYYKNNLHVLEDAKDCRKRNWYKNGVLSRLGSFLLGQRYIK